MENWFWIGPAGGGVCLLFALFQLWRLLSSPKGDEAAQGLSTALRKGTFAYLKWQLLLSVGGLVLVSALLLALNGLGLWDPMLPTLLLSGGACGLLSGLVGALLPALGGPRAAQAAGQRLDRGVRLSLSAGAVSGCFTVGLALVHLPLWFFLLWRYGGYEPSATARLLPLLAAGAAGAALLLQMGAVFARGADMTAQAADREMGLPADSPQDPAVIAQRVGQGVGPAAGMAGLLHCVYELLLALVLSLGQSAYAAADMSWNAMLLPLAVASAGAVLSLVGLLSLRSQERGDRRSLPWSLRQAGLVSALLTAAVTIPLTYLLTGRWLLCLPVFLGLGAGLLIPLAGECLTADTGRSARSLARSGGAGAPAAVTGGLALGCRACLLPLLLLTALLTAAFSLTGGITDPSRGIYGAALAGVGMLSLSPVALAAAQCGPVGETAAHTTHLTGADEASRRGAEELAAIGVAAANGGKCLLTGASGLAGLVLLSSLSLTGEASPQSGLPLLLGALLGAMTALLVSGLLLRAVQSASAKTLTLARRQFLGNKKLLEGDEAPDYAACVGRCATRSLLGSLPALLPVPILAPAVGLLLGPRGLLGFGGALLLLSLTLSPLLTLSHGVLDGARRYVESGREGGRDSERHQVLLAAGNGLASLSQVVGAALPALALVSLTLIPLCLTILEHVPPLWW